MRNPKRIPQLLDRIEELWKQVPDMRFCQLLINLGIITPGTDSWYTEDEDILINTLDINPSEVLYWGTRGKTGTKPVKYVLIKDLDTDHIKAILKTQDQISKRYRETFENELKSRKSKNVVIINKKEYEDKTESYYKKSKKKKELKEESKPSKSKKNKE